MKTTQSKNQLLVFISEKLLELASFRSDKLSRRLSEVLGRGSARDHAETPHSGGAGQ
jgi:hypothetical protein